jgi:hypothetical protein
VPRRVGALQPDRIQRVTRCPSQPRTPPPSTGVSVAPAGHVPSPAEVSSYPRASRVWARRAM